MPPSTGQAKTMADEEGGKRCLNPYCPLNREYKWMGSPRLISHVFFISSKIATLLVNNTHGICIHGPIERTKQPAESPDAEEIDFTAASEAYKTRTGELSTALEELSNLKAQMKNPGKVPIQGDAEAKRRECQKLHQECANLEIQLCRFLDKHGPPNPTMEHFLKCWDSYQQADAQVQDKAQHIGQLRVALESAALNVRHFESKLPPAQRDGDNDSDNTSADDSDDSDNDGDDSGDDSDGSGNDGDNESDNDGDDGDDSGGKLTDLPILEWWMEQAGHGKDGSVLSKSAKQAVFERSAKHHREEYSALVEEIRAETMKLECLEIARGAARERYICAFIEHSKRRLISISSRLRLFDGPDCDTVRRLIDSLVQSDPFGKAEKNKMSFGKILFELKVKTSEGEKLGAGLRLKPGHQKVDCTCASV